MNASQRLQTMRAKAREKQIHSTKIKSLGETQLDLQLRLKFLLLRSPQISIL